MPTATWRSAREGTIIRYRRGSRLVENDSSGTLKSARPLFVFRFRLDLRDRFRGAPANLAVLVRARGAFEDGQGLVVFVVVGKVDKRFERGSDIGFEQRVQSDDDGSGVVFVAADRGETAAQASRIDRSGCLSPWTIVFVRPVRRFSGNEPIRLPMTVKSWATRSLSP